MIGDPIKIGLINRQTTHLVKNAKNPFILHNVYGFKLHSLAHSLTWTSLWIADFDFCDVSLAIVTTMLCWLEFSCPPANSLVTTLTAVRPIREGQPFAVYGAVALKAVSDFSVISTAVQTAILGNGIGTGTGTGLGALATGLAAGRPITPPRPTTVN